MAQRLLRQNDVNGFARNFLLAINSSHRKLISGKVKFYLSDKENNTSNYRLFYRHDRWSQGHGGDVFFYD